MIYVVLLLLSIAVLVLGLAYSRSIAEIHAQVATMAQSHEIAEQLRRHRIALSSALSDDHLALLAWDEHQRFVIVEGGLYARSDMEPPKIGSDARKVFQEWGPDAAQAFERAVSGFADPEPYEVSTPVDMVAAGVPAITYSVRLRSNSAPGAGYAIAHDISNSADAIRQAEADAERARRRAEAEFARAAEYERLIQTRYQLASPAVKA